jgi:hypothetical protein
MNLFRIQKLARNNILLILQGTRYDNTLFTIYISRHENYGSVENSQLNYLFSNGYYYIVSVINNHNNENININNFIWKDVNYNNNDFPYYIYGISDNLYHYIKGMLI